MVSKAPVEPRSGRKNEDARRAALGAFLRSRREKLRPVSVGLEQTGRRRTPGLRREEVAQIAGVGVVWYTWLEQGRDIRASAATLGFICEALQLKPEERAHALELAGLTSAPIPRITGNVPASMLRFLARTRGVVAYVSGPRLDVLAWNALANALYDFSSMRPEDRNSVVMLFGPRNVAAMFPDAGNIKQNVVATLRMNADAHPEPGFEELVRQLSDTSAEFAKLWARHDVHRRKIGRKEIMHPLAGRLVLEHQAFQSVDAPSAAARGVHAAIRSAYQEEAAQAARSAAREVEMSGLLESRVGCRGYAW